MKTLTDFLRNTSRLITTSVRDFRRDGCVNSAAAVSYFALISFIPFFVVLLAVLGYVLQSSQALYAHTLTLLQSLLPGLEDEVAKQIEALIRNARFGLLGFLLCLWLGRRVFSSVGIALNQIFKVSTPRPFLLSSLMSVAMIGLAGLFLLVSFGLTTLRYLGLPGVALSYVLPYALVLLSITLMYRLLPNAKVDLRHALWGAALTSLLWETAKHFFTWYLSQMTWRGSLYGSLATIIISLVWIYYSSAIFFFGAEVVFHLGRRKARDPLPQPRATASSSEGE